MVQTNQYMVKPLELASVPSSLLGTGEPTKFLDLTGLDAKRLDVHPFSSQSKQYAVVLVVASAIIFVAAVAVYECIRVAIQYAFVKNVSWDTSQPPNPKVTLISTIIFAVFCVISAVLIIPMLLGLGPKI
jgi:hypothetical protein